MDAYSVGDEVELHGLKHKAVAVLNGKTAILTRGLSKDGYCRIGVKVEGKASQLTLDIRPKYLRLSSRRRRLSKDMMEEEEEEEDLTVATRCRNSPPPIHTEKMLREMEEMDSRWKQQQAKAELRHAKERAAREKKSEKERMEKIYHGLHIALPFLGVMSLVALQSTCKELLFQVEWAEVWERILKDEGLMWGKKRNTTDKAGFEISPMASYRAALRRRLLVLRFFAMEPRLPEVDPKGGLQLMTFVRREDVKLIPFEQVSATERRYNIVRRFWEWDGEKWASDDDREVDVFKIVTSDIVHVVNSFVQENMRAPDHWSEETQRMTTFHGIAGDEKQGEELALESDYPRQWWFECRSMSDVLDQLHSVYRAVSRSLGNDVIANSARYKEEFLRMACVNGTRFFRGRHVSAETRGSMDANEILVAVTPSLVACVWMENLELYED